MVTIRNVDNAFVAAFAVAVVVDDDDGVELFDFVVFVYSTVLLNCLIL